MAVLDTSFLIALDRGETRAQDLLRRLNEDGEPLLVPAAVRVEYLCGLREETRERAARLLDRATGLAPMDPTTVDRAVLLQAELMAQGRRLGWHDLQVAAMAMQSHDVLVTKDGDFDGILGLLVLRP